MSDVKVARIHASLVDVFGNIAKEFADRIKKEYHLKELFVSDLLASQIVAGKLSGRKVFDFKVRKTGLNSGTLELM